MEKMDLAVIKNSLDILELRIIFEKDFSKSDLVKELINIKAAINGITTEESK